VDYCLIAICVLVIGAFFFYWYSGGPEFGARYWYSMLIPCTALTPGAFLMLKSSFDNDSGVSSFRGTRVTVGILAVVHVRRRQLLSLEAIDKYHHFWGCAPNIRELRERGFGPSLVLVRGQSHPDYTSAAIYNPLDFHAAQPLYAWDKSPQVREQLIEAYPNRAIWLSTALRFRDRVQGRGGPVVRSDLETNVQAEEAGARLSLDVHSQTPTPPPASDHCE